MRGLMMIKMTYELAKKLKEAGYSQDIPEWRGIPEIGFVDDSDQSKPEIEWEHFYDPTLSELIEACLEKKKPINGGENFFSLTENIDTWTAGIYWIERENTKAEGSTPEVAVANLWLALNKK